MIAGLGETLRAAHSAMQAHSESHRAHEYVSGSKMAANLRLGLAEMGKGMR